MFSLYWSIDWKRNIFNKYELASIDYLNAYKNLSDLDLFQS